MSLEYVFRFTSLNPSQLKKAVEWVDKPLPPGGAPHERSKEEPGKGGKGTKGNKSKVLRKGAEVDL